MNHRPGFYLALGMSVSIGVGLEDLRVSLPTPLFYSILNWGLSAASTVGKAKPCGIFSSTVVFIRCNTWQSPSRLPWNKQPHPTKDQININSSGCFINPLGLFGGGKTSKKPWKGRRTSLVLNPCSKNKIHPFLAQPLPHLRIEGATLNPQRKDVWNGRRKK